MPIALAVLISFTVNYLLLLACARLCCHTPGLIRLLPAAGVGAAHVLLCLLPGFSFFGSPLFRLLSIPVMGLVAFGRQELRLQGSLLVLCVAFDALISGSGLPGTLAGVCALLLLWLLHRKKRGGTVPVALSYGGQELKLTALRDTGNGLKDPISGASVMVIGAEAARRLTGLTVQQLKRPLETMGAVPGLRLIPYKAVGNSGFLLAMKLPKVRIGTWQGSYVVAFAPEGLEGNIGFDALVGGSV